MGSHRDSFGRETGWGEINVITVLTHGGLHFAYLYYYSSYLCGVRHVCPGSCVRIVAGLGGLGGFVARVHPASTPPSAVRFFDSPLSGMGPRLPSQWETRPPGSGCHALQGHLLRESSTTVGRLPCRSVLRGVRSLLLVCQSFSSRPS